MPVGNTQVRDLIKKLIYSSRNRFEKMCIELLEVIYPDIVDTRELGEFERFGVDAYTYSRDKYLVAFQFKGFEKEIFGRDQIEQCIKSIKSFSKSNIQFEEYYFIINIPIKDKYKREVLETEIRRSLKNKCRNCFLMDVQEFLKYLLRHYRNFLINKIKKYNYKTISNYRKVVNQTFYYEEIPFETDNNFQDLNLKKYLLHKICGSKENKSYPSNWYFILSEFGIGKTSLVQKMIFDFSQCEIMALYIPISLITPNGLSNTTSIIKEIAELVLGFKISDESQLPHSLIYSLINRLFRSSGSFVLIFDGLDEHNYAYKNVGLRSIFNSIRRFTVPIIFTVRTEFWQERSEDIQGLLTAVNSKKTISIKLLEWEKSTVLAYSKLFADKQNSTSKLDWFIANIENDKYMQHFGDILKRPLFLKMLLHHLKADDIVINNIANLYEKYFIEKLRIDISGASGQADRPLGISGGIITKASEILSMLEKIAKLMLVVENGKILLNDFILEIEIRDILLSRRIEDILEIIMHSVLMPFGNKSIKGMKLKFAHRSYQEYFSARYVFNAIFKYEGESIEKGLIFPLEIIKFFKSIIDYEGVPIEIIEGKKDYEIIKMIHQLE